MADALTDEQRTFLEELDEEFKDRFSEEDDKEYKLALSEKNRIPPVVENWDLPRGQQSRDRRRDNRSWGSRSDRRDDRRRYDGRDRHRRDRSRSPLRPRIEDY